MAARPRALDRSRRDDTLCHLAALSVSWRGPPFGVGNAAARDLCLFRSALDRARDWPGRIVVRASFLRPPSLVAGFGPACPPLYVLTGQLSTKGRGRLRCALKASFETRPAGAPQDPPLSFRAPLRDPGMTEGGSPSGLHRRQRSGRGGTVSCPAPRRVRRASRPVPGDVPGCPAGRPGLVPRDVSGARLNRCPYESPKAVLRSSGQARRPHARPVAPVRAAL
jgi:hypothetical protein